MKSLLLMFGLSSSINASGPAVLYVVQHKGVLEPQRSENIHPLLMLTTLPVTKYCFCCC